MSWSIDSVSYRMAGAGTWQAVLRDQEARQLYSRLYPSASLRSIDARFRGTIRWWQESGVAAVADGRLVLLGPLMTDDDLGILGPWFDHTAEAMSEVIRGYLPDYRALAEGLCGVSATPRQVDNLVTILACAEALDMDTFRLLRRDVMGAYPSRGPAGRFFFWGYAFSAGPGRIFGVTTYGRAGTARVSVIRSRGLGRGDLPALLAEGPALALLTEMCGGATSRKALTSGAEPEIVRRLREVAVLEPDDPPRLAVPVVDSEGMERVARLNVDVSASLAAAFKSRLAELRELVPRCSFAECSPADIMCMVLHLAYSYSADALVESAALPDFPRQAGGEWGVWVHSV